MDREELLCAYTELITHTLVLPHTSRQKMGSVPEGREGVLRSAVFWTWCGRCTQELTVARS